jgi:hypothetical protein
VEGIPSATLEILLHILHMGITVTSGRYKIPMLRARHMWGAAGPDVKIKEAFR